MAHKRKKFDDVNELVSDNTKKRKKTGRILASFGSDSSSSEEDEVDTAAVILTNPVDSSQKTNDDSSSQSLLPPRPPQDVKSNGAHVVGENHYDSDTEEEADDDVPNHKNEDMKKSNSTETSTKPATVISSDSSDVEEVGSYIMPSAMLKGHSEKKKKKKKKEGKHKSSSSSSKNRGGRDDEYQDDNVDENYDVFDESSEDDDDKRQQYSRMKPEKKAKILEFFEKGSEEELCYLSKCSAKKAQLLVELRPYTSWKNLVDKLNMRNKLNQFLIGSCVDLLKERNVLLNLMNKCSAISDNFQREFQNVGKDNKFVSEQPSNIPDHLTLKPYQLIGLNWISLLHRHNVNGVLADEMGLGKTIQTIAFLAHLIDSGVSAGPHLIVVPSSTADNWRREFDIWCPNMNLINYAGNQVQRREIRHNILHGKLKGNVILTTYNLAISQPEDRALFKKINTYFAVFDEGHMLKSMSSQRYQYLMRLNAKHRLLLTGTPLQNNLLELMSLLKFVMPHMFDESTSTLVKMFSSNSDVASPFSQRRIQHAKRIMQPFVLRRLKCDVLSQLPQKVDRVVHCPMTPLQQSLYDKVSQMFKNKSDGKKLPKSELKNVFMEMRKIANHPLLRRERFTNEKLLKMARLLKKSPTFCESNETFIYEDMEVMTDFELDRLCANNRCISSYKLDQSVIAESGKFNQLDEIIPAYKAAGKRILLFTQFTMVLDIIESYLKMRDLKYLRLDGQTPVTERLDLIDTFNNDESYTLFILSTKAGGLGINLTSASVVIIHDIDCNPYNDKQAEDRCHRLGQTKTVEVVRLLGKDTIEVGMHKNALKKLRLEKDMTENNEDDMDIVALITENIL